MIKTNENSKINILKKFLFEAILGMAIFSFNPIIAQAAIVGGGGTGDSGSTENKVIESDNAESSKAHLETYCSFWSADYWEGYESLADFDNNANKDGSAPLISAKNPQDGRKGDTTSKTYSEDIYEYEG